MRVCVCVCVCVCVREREREGERERVCGMGWVGERDGHGGNNANCLNTVFTVSIRTDRPEQTV